ncbi:glucosyltransferase domain-containing protein [Neobacillus cucumis]|uniref:glucosyltransferase domain-containing protein n=1 Tax=Neobacillus cucumis TaxID=1740721 RepID=UPI002E1E4923|nr:glucosyltransferase domain-containing protein [Neobacillus cucumis]
MRDFLKNEKNEFLAFVQKAKFLLVITIFFMILSYGIKLFYFDFSIDTEAILDDYPQQMDNWLNVNRLGLVFTKYLLFHHRFNPFVANILTFFTFTIVCYFLSYLVHRILGPVSKSAGMFILPILFLTHPIFAEQFNFTLQNFEVALGILFQVLALLLTYYYTQKNYIIFPVVAIVLNIWSFLTYQALYSFFITGAVVSILLILCRDQKESQPRAFSGYLVIILKYSLIYLLSFILAQLLAITYTKIMHIPSGTYLTRQILWGKLPTSEVIQEIQKQLSTVFFAKNASFYNYGFIISTILVLFIFIKKIVKRVPDIYLEIFVFLVLYLSPFLLTIIIGQGEAIRAQMPALELVIAFNFYYVYWSLHNHWLRKALVTYCLILAFNQSYAAANLLFSEHVKYKEDVTLANRMNVQLDNLGVGDRADYSLVILGKHEPESVVVLPGETLGRSFFAWDIGTRAGTTYRAIGFMRILGYPFHRPTSKQLDYAHSIEKELTVWPKKDSIRIHGNLIVIKLSN